MSRNPRGNYNPALDHHPTLYEAGKGFRDLVLENQGRLHDANRGSPLGAGWEMTSMFKSHGNQVNMEITDCDRYGQSPLGLALVETFRRDEYRLWSSYAQFQCRLDERFRTLFFSETFAGSSEPGISPFESLLHKRTLEDNRLQAINIDWAIPVALSSPAATARDENGYSQVELALVQSSINECEPRNSWQNTPAVWACTKPDSLALCLTSRILQPPTGPADDFSLLPMIRSFVDNMAQHDRLPTGSGNRFDLWWAANFEVGECLLDVPPDYADSLDLWWRINVKAGERQVYTPAHYLVVLTTCLDLALRYPDALPCLTQAEVAPMESALSRVADALGIIEQMDTADFPVDHSVDAPPLSPRINALRNNLHDIRLRRAVSAQEPFGDTPPSNSPAL